MEKAVTLGVEGGLATLRIGREHGNAINGAVVDQLSSLCQEAEANPDVRGVLLAASGKLFTPGLDIRELVELDRPALHDFMRRFNACMLTLYTFSKPMVAAIHGHALAGGYLLTLSADWRILRRGAKVGLNEIRIGVPLPFGVSMILRESVPKAHLEEVALFGRNYTDDRALQAGFVHEVLPGDGFEPACLARLDELARKDLNAFAVTKRYLRSATVERIRANDPSFTPEFLDAWFSESTQERIRALAAELRRSES